MPKIAQRIDEETVHRLVETTSFTFLVSSFYVIYYFAIEFVRKEKQGESRVQVEIKESCQRQVYAEVRFRKYRLQTSS